jgi:hypothetical protein
MADHEHHVTRSVAYLTDSGELVANPLYDPLVALYWSRLDEEPDSADIAAKKAILDDYTRHCADTANPAREMICTVTRGVIQRLATVYADRPGYNPEWRP